MDQAQTPTMEVVDMDDSAPKTVVLLELRMVTGKNFEFDLGVGRFVIGRQQNLCDIHVHGVMELSRKHAIIEIRQPPPAGTPLGSPQCWIYIKDLGSNNGTYINGQAIGSEYAYPLMDQDCLKFANVEARFFKKPEVGAPAASIDLNHTIEMDSNTLPPWSVSQQPLQPNLLAPSTQARPTTQQSAPANTTTKAVAAALPPPAPQPTATAIATATATTATAPQPPTSTTRKRTANQIDIDASGFADCSKKRSRSDQPTLANGTSPTPMETSCDDENKDVKNISRPPPAEDDTIESLNEKQTFLASTKSAGEISIPEIITTEHSPVRTHDRDDPRLAATELQFSGSDSDNDTGIDDTFAPHLAPNLHDISSLEVRLEAEELRNGADDHMQQQQQPSPTPNSIHQSRLAPPSPINSLATTVPQQQQQLPSPKEELSPSHDDLAALNVKQLTAQLKSLGCTIASRKKADMVNFLYDTLHANNPNGKSLAINNHSEGKVPASQGSEAGMRLGNSDRAMSQTSVKSQSISEHDHETVSHNNNNNISSNNNNKSTTTIKQQQTPSPEAPKQPKYKRNKSQTSPPDQGTDQIQQHPALQERTSSDAGDTNKKSQDVFILFTGWTPDKKDKVLTKMLKDIVVEHVEECTVLVTDKVRKTLKFLQALCRGKPIVSHDWLSACKRAESIIDFSPYILDDPAFTKEYGFPFSESLDKAKNPIFKAKIFAFALEEEKANDLQQIVEAGGAQVLPSDQAKTLFKKNDPNAMIVSDPELWKKREFARKWKWVKDLGFQLISKDFITATIFGCKVDPAGYGC